MGEIKTTDIDKSTGYHRVVNKDHNGKWIEREQKIEKQQKQE